MGGDESHRNQPIKSSTQMQSRFAEEDGEWEIPGGHPATRGALAAAGSKPAAQAVNGNKYSGVGIPGSGRRRTLRHDPLDSPALLPFDHDLR